MCVGAEVTCFAMVPIKAMHSRKTFLLLYTGYETYPTASYVSKTIKYRISGYFSTLPRT